MLFFGRGTRTRTWATEDGRWVSATYDYVHFLFLLRFVTRVRWHLLERERGNDRRISRNEVEELFPSGRAPAIGFFVRYLGVLLLAALVCAVTLPEVGFADARGRWAALLFLIGFSALGLCAYKALEAINARSAGPTEAAPVSPMVK